MNTEEIKEIIQSSNLNFLIGAGLSRPFLPTLNSIETRLCDEKDETKKIPIYREYYKEVMLPNLKFAHGKADKCTELEFQETYKNYKDFFEFISALLIKRKSTILSKQANIFTTNIDLLMETVLEDSNLEYNDGFAGHLIPSFSLSNFKKTISKRSLHFDNVSEIPTFNLMKMHGSLTWERVGEKILFSNLTQIDENILKASDRDFSTHYHKLSIVNPEKKKLQETVIDLYYYELLRMYSSELEKQNTVLFVMGCSLADEHIRQITLRSANSNPTLKIYICCYEKKDVAALKILIGYVKLRYSNIEILEPEDDTAENKMHLGNIIKNVLTKNKNHTTDEPK